jgi:hypothetical protein
MSDEVPEGAAVFPLIPDELGVHPLLLAVLHAVVFLDGSEKNIVHPDAATEALEYIAGYLQRLEGAELRRVKEDIAALTAFAREDKWPKPLAQFVKDFLASYGASGSDKENS